jgi:hypothetical protein
MNTFTWYNKTYFSFQTTLIFGFTNHPNKCLKWILCIGPIHNVYYFPFQSACLSNFNFICIYMTKTLRKPHVPNENYQNFHMIQITSNYMWNRCYIYVIKIKIIFGVYLYFSIYSYKYIFHTNGCIHDWGTKKEWLVFKRLQRTTLNFF